MIKQFVRDLHYALNKREHAIFTHLLPEEKRERLAAFASCHDNFVETGTYLGETAAAMASAYLKVFTVEIHEVRTTPARRPAASPRACRLPSRKSSRRSSPPVHRSI